MEAQQATGQILLVIGAICLLAGAWLYFGGGLGPLGRLPGDIRIEGERGGIYFPLMSGLVISIVLTLLLNAWWWFRSR